MGDIKDILERMVQELPVNVKKMRKTKTDELIESMPQIIKLRLMEYSFRQITEMLNNNGRDISCSLIKNVTKKWLIQHRQHSDVGLLATNQSPAGAKPTVNDISGQPRATAVVTDTKLNANEGGWYSAKAILSSHAGRMPAELESRLHKIHETSRFYIKNKLYRAEFFSEIARQLDEIEKAPRAG